jgi:TolB protein
LKRRCSWDDISGRDGVSRQQPAPAPSGGSRNAEIFVMDADGTNKTRITRHPAGDGEPAFSPDGKEIAFASNRATFGSGDTYFSDIWTIKANGSDPTRLTAGFFSEANPDWQPLP